MNCTFVLHSLCIRAPHRQTIPLTQILSLLLRLSPEERANVEAQLDELTATYSTLCDSSTQQLQQLEQQLAKEEERKVFWLEGWAEMETGHCRFMTTCILLIQIRIQLQRCLHKTLP